MHMNDSGPPPWDIQAARNLYNIQSWGARYFDINEAGHVVARPLQEGGAAVDVTDVIEEAKGRGLKFPLLIRFQDLLRHRVESVNLAFRSSIKEFNYQGNYRGVFPIKVNQLREVVEEILDAGKPFDFGLEVGSKPELFAGLALQNQMGSLIVCNGYKDAAFVRMALLGTKLGRKVIMVVEKLEELRQIIAVSKQLGVEAILGMRVRLLSKGGGKWADSAGENAKFGLTTGELLIAAEMLKSEGLAHSFKLLHFHIGSQVPDILIVKRAVQEAARFYAKLNKPEAYHDAVERKEDAQHMFTLGMLDLPEKAKIEHLYWEIGRQVVDSYKGQAYIPEEIRKLEDSLGDQYLCNFSVFQSLLDHWALGQLFPIMPVNRLNERPTREATLVDITCDSDGQINKFIDLRDVRDTLPLHSLNYNANGQEPYYLGFFLMGAYQDIMGDLHNLFGRVNEVHVFLDPDEPAGYYVEEIIEGTTIVQALDSVQYDEKELKRQMKGQVDEAIKSDRMKPSEAMRLLDDYERGLKEYTYLSF